MPMTKINRKKEEKTSELIKKLLNIKDSNLYFVEDPLAKETISGKLTNVFTGILTYTPSCCPACGCVNEGQCIIRHTYYERLFSSFRIKRFLTYCYLSSAFVVNRTQPLSLPRRPMFRKIVTFRIH
ncbi:hypothetical protein ACWODT_10940 [Enterococcus phoeniculicola]|jgi:hypothetical protein|uniref:Transposase IS204/IS1001/IS1096/IS1165 zinc-finger domain-containing protein n=1 Tax=Enterococcus phoeniculicola ATCC BAA-412 TaxID=1158610 RepID=R3WPR6_9ENTE|nr:hypothetical protein [Enterococcus phoeniculicola]EOL43825.1 hypothetical protein UC3_01806 [Enterococcus phoeniculicola ATCC BAA-412]EOT76811.1 hypothetical protein I589_01769 [Enterococcus phoeniculicola ATCC BAA-412]